MGEESKQERAQRNARDRHKRVAFKQEVDVVTDEGVLKKDQIQVECFTSESELDEVVASNDTNVAPMVPHANTYDGYVPADEGGAASWSNMCAMWDRAEADDQARAA